MAQRTNTAAYAASAVVPSVQQPIHTVVQDGFGAWHREFMAQVAMYLPATRKVAKGQTVGLSLEEKVYFKAMRLVGRQLGSKDAIKPRATLNSMAKRQAITDRDTQRAHGRATKAAAEAAALAAMQHKHQITGVSVAKLEARKAEGDLQRALNKGRKLAKALAREISLLEGHTEAHVVKPTYVKAAKVRAPKRAKVWHMMHTVESVAKQAEDRLSLAAYEAAHKALMAKYHEDRMIAKARRAEKRALWIELRARRIQRMVTQVWFDKGIMVDAALQRACNDADHDIRTTAYTELLSLVGVAA